MQQQKCFTANSSFPDRNSWQKEIKRLGFGMGDKKGVPSRVCDDPGAGRIFYEFRDETSRDEAWMDIWAIMSVLISWSI